MIGHFLTPMTDKGLEGTETSVPTNLQGSEAKSTEDFHHLLFQQESSSFAMEIPTTDAVDKGARIAIVFPGILFVQSDFCIFPYCNPFDHRLSFSKRLAASFVTILTAFFFFFATWIIRPLPTGHLQEMSFIEWCPFPLSSYLPLQFSSPALALYTLFCFSEAEI